MQTVLFKDKENVSDIYLITIRALSIYDSVLRRERNNSMVEAVLSAPLTFARTYAIMSA